MNKTKTLLIRIITVVFFVALAVLMYFLGRGHTVYIDNKKLEYNGTTYDTPYKVEVYVGGERIVAVRQMILAEDVKGPDGKELAKAGQRAGYGTSTTNWSNWR